MKTNNVVLFVLNRVFTSSARNKLNDGIAEMSQELGSIVQDAENPEIADDAVLQRVQKELAELLMYYQWRHYYIVNSMRAKDRKKYQDVVVESVEFVRDRIQETINFLGEHKDDLSRPKIVERLRALQISVDGMDGLVDTFFKLESAGKYNEITALRKGPPKPLAPEEKALYEKCAREHKDLQSAMAHADRRHQIFQGSHDNPFREDADRYSSPARE